MDDRPLPRLTEDDPRNYLDDAARRRIDAANWQGQTLRQRVLAELELEYNSEKDPTYSFGEYTEYGDGAVRMARARMEHARLVLQASLKEYKTAGISGQELDRIMRDELEGAVHSLELSITQRDLLSMELNAPVVAANSPDEPKPALTDEIYEQDIREAEQRYQIAMADWLGITVREMQKLPKRPKVDAKKIAAEIWSAAWRGEEPSYKPESPPPIPLSVLSKLSQICEAFLKAEIRAYVGVLQRSGIPSSQILTRLEDQLGRILFATRTRKWRRALEERIPAGFFKNDYYSVMRCWGVVEDAIKEFVHNDLEFDFWAGTPEHMQPLSIPLESKSQKPSPSPSPFGETINRLRLSKGWSWDETSKRSGIDKKLLLGYANAGKRAHPRTLHRLAKCFGVEVRDLNYH